MKQRLAAILAADAVTQGRRMRFRIGLHLGEIIEKADGSAYGDGINIAARIQSVAEPDSVCLSQRVYDHGCTTTGVRPRHGKLDAKLLELGHGELKNIAVPVRIFRALLPSVLPVPQCDENPEPAGQNHPQIPPTSQFLGGR